MWDVVTATSIHRPPIITALELKLTKENMIFFSALALKHILFYGPNFDGKFDLSLVRSWA